MDTNDCNMNHLVTDVLLPPRKRLLAGLKKQSCSESTSHCSQEHNTSSSLSLSLSPSPSLSHSPLSEFDNRLNNLLKSCNNGSNMSAEEIAEAAGLAAVNAGKAAEVARAAAEEKASVAAKAVAAAKSALDLVASISGNSSHMDKHEKKNKLKKHVPVQVLYKKYHAVENCGTDEELARRLHRAMNSSPRISKYSPGSNSKNHKHKKLKFVPTNGNSKLPSTSNGDVVEGGMDYEGSNEESHSVKVDDEVTKSSKLDSKNHKHKKLKFAPPNESSKLHSTCNGDFEEGGMDFEGSNEESSKPTEVEVDNGEVESSHSKERTFQTSDIMCSNVRKRGRIKQKKLPLSIFSFKDQANPKEELNLTSPLLTRARADKLTARPLADNVTPVEVGPT